MDPFEQFKSAFIEEAREYLEEMQRELAGLDPNDPDIESLHAIFRGVHSIKGGAATFGYSGLIGFSHTFETVLDGLRSGDMPVTDEIVDVLLSASDVLTALVDAAETGDEPDLDAAEPVSKALERLIGSEPTAEAPTEPEVEEPEAATETFEIVFAPSSDMMQRANEPLLIIRQLKRLGALRVTADTSDIPSLDQMDPLAAYLRWEIELISDAGREAVEEAFEFLSEDCHLEIEVVAAAAMDMSTDDASSDDGLEPDEFEFVPVPAGAPIAESDEKTATVGADDEVEPDEFGFPPVKAPGAVTAGTTETPPVETETSEPQVSPAVSPALDKPEPAKQGTGEKSGGMSIRVDLEKIDRLVNMVGELVIAQAMLSQQAEDMSQKQNVDITHGLDSLGQTVRGIQESVMSIRAQPLKSIFARMSRVVRDLSRDTGKEIRLETVGAETEVDKTVIEHLTDPLTHMIRNSADHGIEMPDDREANGKPRLGTIRLSARHRSGRVVIEVSDDGAGINRPRVRANAVDKGLIAADADLSDEEIDNLIFAPGFSTAETVSNLSGRGVGMDVVRRNIQELGGRVTIQSEPRLGSTITMTLPLTLAVMDGMIVRVGDEIFILPLTSIVETVKPSRDEIHPLVNGSNVLASRGEYIPLVQIRNVFGISEAAADPADGLIVLVEDENDQKVGIGIDEMMRQQQVVLKSLEENYIAVEGVSAATILGDGRVALILDIAGLCDRASRVPDDLASLQTTAVMQEETRPWTP